MKDTVTVTFTREQYDWVRAIALDTYKDACQWLDEADADGSIVFITRQEYNRSVRDMAQQVSQIKGEA
jgi:hypothetical protein